MPEGRWWPRPRAVPRAALLPAALAAAGGCSMGYGAGLWHGRGREGAAALAPPPECVGSAAARGDGPPAAAQAAATEPPAAPPTPRGRARAGGSGAGGGGECAAQPGTGIAPFEVYPPPPPPPAPPPGTPPPAVGHYLPCGLKNFTYRYRGKVKLLHHWRKEPSGLRCASSTFASLRRGRICVHDRRCLQGGSWSPCRPIRRHGVPSAPPPSFPLTHGADIGGRDCVVAQCPGAPGCRFRHALRGRCAQGGRNVLTQVVPSAAAARRALESAERRRRGLGGGAPPLLSVLVLLIDSVAWNSYIANFPGLQAHVHGLTRRGIHAFSFCHSRSVGHNSAPCQVPMMTGLNHDEIRRPGVYSRGRDLIFAEAQRAGFVTAYHFGAVWFEMFPALELTSSGQADWRPVTELDHWNWEFLTEETQTPAANTFQDKRYGCVGDRLSTDFLPPFVEGVFEGYPPSARKFVWAFDELPHQNDRDMAPRTEPALVRTLDYLERSGHLNATAVLLLSDHGLGMGHWSETKLGRRERWNPMFTMLLPGWFADAYPAQFRALQLNQHQISSSYDVHQTVRHLISLPSDPPPPKSHGASLLQALDAGRSCRAMGLLEKSCPTLQETDLPVAALSPELRAALEALARDAMLVVNAYVTEKQEHRDCHAALRLLRLHEVTKNEMKVLKEDDQVFYDLVFISDPPARWHIKVSEEEVRQQRLSRGHREVQRVYRASVMRHDEIACPDTYARNRVRMLFCLCRRREHHLSTILANQ